MTGREADMEDTRTEKNGLQEKISVLEKANEIHKSGDPYKIGLLDGFLMGLTGRNAEQEIKPKEAQTA